MQGLVVLGVIVLGDDKRVVFVIVLLLLLVVGVVAEGCQHPPHNHGAREALKPGPCFVVGHAPLNSEGKLGCCHNAVVQANPRAAVSASCANFALDGSGCRGLEQCWFCGTLSKSSLSMLCLAWRRWPVGGVHGIFGSVLSRGFLVRLTVVRRPCKTGHTSILAHAGVLAG